MSSFFNDVILIIHEVQVISASIFIVYGFDIHDCI